MSCLLILVMYLGRSEKTSVPNLSLASWIMMLVCALEEVANGFYEC